MLSVVDWDQELSFLNTEDEYNRFLAVIIHLLKNMFLPVPICPTLGKYLGKLKETSHLRDFIIDS